MELIFPVINQIIRSGSIGTCLGRFQVTEKFSCWQSIAMAVPNGIKGALCVPNMLSLLNHPLHLAVPRKEIGQCLQVSTVAQWYLQLCLAWSCQARCKIYRHGNQGVATDHLWSQFSLSSIVSSGIPSCEQAINSSTRFPTMLGTTARRRPVEHEELESPKQKEPGKPDRAQLT